MSFVQSIINSDNYRLSYMTIMKFTTTVFCILCHRHESLYSLNTLSVKLLKTCWLGIWCIMIYNVICLMVYNAIYTYIQNGLKYKTLNMSSGQGLYSIPCSYL